MLVFDCEANHLDFLAHLEDFFRYDGKTRSNERLYIPQAEEAEIILDLLGRLEGVSITPDQFLFACSIAAKEAYSLKGREAVDYIKMLYVSFSRDVKVLIGRPEYKEDLSYIKTCGISTRAYCPVFSGLFIGKDGKNRREVAFKLSEILKREHWFNIIDSR